MQHDTLNQGLPAPVSARERATPGVRWDDTMAEAARKLLHYQFHRMLDHEAGARTGEDDEAIHRMRVATRRMRAAAKLFKPAIKSKAFKPHRAGLRATAKMLGNVRDFDVLLLNLRAYQTEQPAKQGEAIAPLLEAWQSQRDYAHVELTAYLNGEAYHAFVESFGRLLATPWEAVAARDELEANSVAKKMTHPNIALSQVRFAASNLIWHRYSVVRAYGPVVKAASVEQLHDLRIEAKYLRYSLEFFMGVLQPGARKLIERVTALQDHLGALNDADSAARRAREFLQNEAQSLRPEQRRAISKYVAAREQEVRMQVESTPHVWRDVGGADFRRRLALVLANL